jgi:hypothetical protein
VAVKEVTRVSLTELLRYAAARGGNVDLPSEALQALDVATKHSLAIRKGWHLTGRNNNLVFPPQVRRSWWAWNLTRSQRVDCDRNSRCALLQPRRLKGER